MKSEGVRKENSLGGQLCGYKGSLTLQNMTCMELLKKVKALEDPNSEAFHFFF